MVIKNRRIVITGGTSGIGYELVRQLQTNNELIVVSKSTEKLDKLSQEFASVSCYQADLSEHADIEAVANTLNNQYDSIDILINNAAVQFTPTFIGEEFNYASISYEITLNFTSVCSLTYLLLPNLLHDSKAIILNINSGLALAPKTSSAIYCATKGALEAFSQSLRYQLENTNIQVQQAFLELVDTAMTTGRGKNKMSAEKAAATIIHGMERETLDHDIGKVKFLRFLLRLAPSLAKKIMKKY